MSAWGKHTLPPFGLFAERPDLGQWQQAAVDEARGLGLELTSEATVKDSAGVSYWVGSYEGRDRLGRPTRATRVASPRGVVLALGPPTEADPPEMATELVRSAEVGAGQVVSFPTDLDGDEQLELLLRSRSGRVRLYRLAPHGATEVQVELSSPPTAVVRMSDGGLALAGPWELPEAEGGSTQLFALAAPHGAGFSGAAEVAQNEHRRLAEDLADAPELEARAARSRRLAMRGFHLLLAGEASGGALAVLSAPKDETAEERALRDARRALLEKLARKAHPKNGQRQVPPP